MSSWTAGPVDPAHAAVPEEPDPFVVRALESVPAPRSTRVLEAGCAGGRHLVWLGRHGFAAWGSGRAVGLLARARAWLEREGLPARLVLADPGAQPFPGGWFDVVVVQEVPAAGASGTVAELARVLRDEGMLVGAVPSGRSWRPGLGEVEARDLLAAFDVDTLALDEFSDDEGRRHSRWQFVAVRRAR